jgi:3-hydroxy-9,10-secoandrosta-1,3,5(10)-triene-9,17-dione monooxygenase reductase component
MYLCFGSSRIRLALREGGLMPYRNGPDAATEPVRTGFGRLAVAVAVITAFDDDRPHGCTGMAWAEHVEPPLLLTTLRRGGHTRKLVEMTQRFGVSVLSEEQTGYVRRFAARSPEPGARFDGVSFSPGRRLGLPLLDGCVASFECEVDGIYPFGGHDIVVGRVAGASAPRDGRPVIHYSGHLWALREAAE